MRVTAHTTINKKLQIRTERGCQAVDSVWSHAAWCFVPHTNLMQLKSITSIIRCHGPLVTSQTVKLEDVPWTNSQVLLSCHYICNGGTSYIQEVLLGRQEWGLEVGKLPLPCLGCGSRTHTYPPPPPRGLMPTLLPAFSPSLGWKLWIPFRGHSTRNCPWCQSRVSICLKTLQCHVPSREQGAGKNQPEQVFVSPECALLSVGLCWLSGPEQSVCPSGVPPVPVCHRL